MKNKLKGIIFFSKNIKDNDLYIKVLSSKDEINSGMVYGGNSSKKKFIYQKGYFIDYSLIKKNENIPPFFNAETTNPYLGNFIYDKYKLNALLSIMSLINVSILEGQTIKGFYSGVENLIVNIINHKYWIVFYCEWLFYLLQLIGYQIDYKKNNNKKYYDIIKQEFLYESNQNTIDFPYKLFSTNQIITYGNINSIFIIFESVFSNNHLENINYEMPVNYLNFKKIILNRLKL